MKLNFIACLLGLRSRKIKCVISLGSVVLEWLHFSHISDNEMASAFTGFVLFLPLGILQQTPQLQAQLSWNEMFHL